LGIDGAVDIFYNTFIVDGDLEQGWVCILSAVIREFAKKVLYPCKPSKRCCFGMFRIRVQILALAVGGRNPPPLTLFAFTSVREIDITNE
jgi:hypothetical protein